MRVLRFVFAAVALFSSSFLAWPAVAEVLPESSTNPPDDRPRAEWQQQWQTATDAAQKQDWKSAAALGKQAFREYLQQPGESPETTCELLDALCFWHTRAREFPAALAAGKELHERIRQRFTDDFWQTVDARLQVALVERLSQLSPQQWQQILKADGLCDSATSQHGTRKFSEAIQNAEQALTIYSDVLGRKHPLSQNCVVILATCHFELGQYLKAKPYVEECIAIDPDPKGILHPDTARKIRLLANFNSAAGALRDAEEAFRKVIEIDRQIYGHDHPQVSVEEVELAKVLLDGKNFTAARPLLEAALDAQKKQFGEEHPATAQTMKILGVLLAEEGDFAAAEPLLKGSVEFFAKFAAQDRLPVASALNARGRMRMLAGQYQEAMADLLNSLEICEQQLGDEHPNTVKVLSNVAELYETGNNLGMARQVRLVILNFTERTFGELNPRTIEAVEHVARLYIRMNDFSVAEPYLLRARESRRKLDGEKHPHTANVVSQLALCYLGVGDPTRAKPLFFEAIKVFDETVGPDSIESAEIHEQLGLIFQSEGHFDEAEQHYRQAIAALQHHKTTTFRAATVQVGHAQTLLSQGKIIEACEMVDGLIATYRERLSYNAPEWFDALGVAGTVYLAAGDTDRAREHISRGLHIASLRLRMTGDFESERQRLLQMQFVRTMLDLYLSLPESLQTEGASIYPHVLDWKGAIAVQQWRDRQQTSDEAATVIAELREIVRKLATINLRAPPPEEREAWMRQLFDLNMRKESLEQQLAVESAGSRVVASEPQMRDLQQLLTPDVALIDILQFVHSSYEKQNGKPTLVRRPRYVAFIVRKFRPVQRIELGDVEPIAAAVVNWRKSRGFRPNAGKTDWAAKVSEILWPRLKPFVGDCQTLLISPDGILAQLAWGALPGNEPDRYLLEDYAISMVPVPKLLAAQARQPARPPVGHSLLLIGNVDYDAARDADAERSESKSQFHFSPLPGTAAETQSLRLQFINAFADGDVSLLESADATEAAFWREAPRHRWLHIATHGFFAPANIKTALTTQNRMDPNSSQQDGVSMFHRDYLNGLAFSGANIGSAIDGDDGILTAAELSMTDLRHVDLAVLSGCETGLGQIQPGEGSFGMQRALQVAGVRTTVGSLWTVSDNKTNLLMQRFYQNLWDRKLSKLESLREAQLWMLHSGGNSDSGRPENKSAKRTSPHYWAAFTLSGDWR